MKTLVTLFLIFAALHMQAQSVNTTVKFNKTDKPALMLYLPYTTEVAEGTILTKLKETGFSPESKGSLFWKQNKVDGYYAFKGVNLKGENNETVNLYFKVERRGSKKDKQSVMYMLTERGSEVFVTDLSDPQTYRAAQNFLNGFVSETATYKHTLDIQAQEETVRKAEKKLVDLMDNEKDLSSKIAKLQDELRKNKETQESQKATIENEKKKLSDLRSTTQ